MSEPERIRCSAIQKNGITYTGPDFDGLAHGKGNHAAIRDAHPEVHEMLKFSTTGFVTSDGRYVDRKEAARIALAVGQIKELHYQMIGSCSAKISIILMMTPMRARQKWSRLLLRIAE